jgi:type III pantothenate kinase
MKLPIAFDYTTFDTLGLDRIANACAVHYLFPNQNCLVIDAGTCVTYSVIKNGAFIGGAISPGLQMRFKSLHHFTGRLPLLSSTTESIDTTGKSTDESILSGVEVGIVKEIEGMIDSFCSENGPLNVILTGGDGSYLGSRLKSPIFANENLTLEGLNQIYLYQLS